MPRTEQPTCATSSHDEGTVEIALLFRVEDRMAPIPLAGGMRA